MIILYQNGCITRISIDIFQLITLRLFSEAFGKQMKQANLFPLFDVRSVAKTLRAVVESPAQYI